MLEARQAADVDSAQVVPIGTQALAHYDRPAPTLGSYDALLYNEQVTSQPATHHSEHRAAGRVVAGVSA